MNTSNAHDPKQNYGAETWRAPTIKDGETVLLDEPGRVLPSNTAGYETTYQSFYLRLVRVRFGGVALLIKHGAGEERIYLGTRGEAVAAALRVLDSYARYSVLFTIYDAAKDARQRASDETELEEL